MKKYLILLLTLFFIGCGEQNSQNSGENSQNSSLNEDKISDDNSSFRVGQKIELKSVNGAKISLIRGENGFKIEGNDKIIMFDIFGTYCQPCRDEAKNLMDFQLKNSDKVQIIALVYYEDVSDKHVVENFMKRYNAYYFIANDKKNGRLVEAILNDIGFSFDKMALPFKVILKDGTYRMLQNGTKYHLGVVQISKIQEDIEKIL